jgi:large exoprotein involved in heme utilization and adhesion
MMVTAEETITIAGTGVDSGLGGLFSVTRSDQDAGTIAISAPAIDIKDGGQILANTFGAGRAGEIVIEAGSLSLTGGARIDSSSTRNASGGAGSVTIRGLDGQGIATNIVRLTNSEVNTAAEGTGAGGSITMAAETIALTDTTLSATVNDGMDMPGGQRGDITLTTPMLTMTGGSITAETTGSRSAGNITLNVEDLSASSQARLSSSSTEEATGDAGSLTIQGQGGIGTSANTVLLNASELLTVAEGTGTGGAIHIRATDIDLNNSNILARALGSGDAGNITLEATHVIELSDASSINTQAEKASGGGNIDIGKPQFLILDSSDILARAGGGQAPASDIGIVADYIIRSPDSVIIASGSINIEGIVEIDLQKGLVELPVVFIDAASQVRASCEARRTGGENTFTEEGRGGLLPELGTEMPAFYTLGAGGKHAADYLDGSRIAHQGLTAAMTPFVGRSTVCIDFHR